MKIEHITKLILKFIGGGTIKFPTCFLKWIIVEPCDGDGGDTPGSMSLDDFKNFNISVPDNMYWVNRNIGDIVQLDEILNVSSIDVFRALTSLNVDSDTEIFPSMVFTIMNGVEGGMYRHNITISPKNNLGFNIDITTNGDYVEGDMAIHEYCNMHLYFNGETLEIINITEGE